MNQKTIILTILLAFLTILGFSQKDMIGTYQAWFDICDRDYKHFSMTIEIDSTDIVHFTYQDDTQKRTASGKLKINNDTIYFEPMNEKDTEFIEDYFGQSTLWNNKGVIMWKHQCPEKDRISIFRKIERE